MSAGSDEAVVFVPGLGCTARLFEPQMSALALSRSVRVADHRQDPTIPAIAARLLSEAPPRFALLGLSMGGYIALEAVRQAPDRISRLALLDTSARADTPEARDRRLALIALAEAGRLDEVTDQLWPRLVHPDRLGDAALRTVVGRMMEETGPAAFVRQQRAIIEREDARALLSQLEIPTLVLVGDSDALTPPDLAREMADLVEWASLVIVPGCGHLSTLEEPKTSTRAIQAWLSA